MLKDKLLYLFEKYIYWRPVAVVYARPYTYMSWTIKKRNCPFCDMEEQDIVEECNYWLVIKNLYPYPRHNIHFMIVPKRHIEKKSELLLHEIEELYEIEERYIKKYDAFVMNRMYWRASSSVAHLHIHILSDYKLP